MIYISHRGNISGPNPNNENHPDYIKEALKQGYQVKVDVWIDNNKYLLGNSCPTYEIEKSFLYNSKLWCQAHNIITISELASRGNLMHYFYKNKDTCSLTSRGWIWVNSESAILSKKIIAYVPGPTYDITLAGGICSDYIQSYKPA